jgi:hypothetical protein
MRIRRKRSRRSADQSNLIGELSEHFGREKFLVVTSRATDLHTLLSDKVI